MRSIFQVIRVLSSRYPHRFFYSIVGFILAVMLMIFGFWKMLIIIAITSIFYFVGLLSDNGVSLREFVKKIFKI